MTTHKGISQKSTKQTSAAINATTGNLIARDEANGQFFVVKEVNLKEIVSKYTEKGGKIRRRQNSGLTTNKRRAARAEKAVLSYLNKSQE